VTLYNKMEIPYQCLRTPRRDRSAGRHGVPGRCSPEEDDRALGEARPRVRGWIRDQRQGSR